MKAEERHRLHENELRRLTEHARLRGRPFLDRYGTTILFALAAVLLVVAAALYFGLRGDPGEAAGWSELDAAFRDSGATAEDFANVAEVSKDSNPRAADWARLFEGEAHLSSGLESLFTDKAGAVRDLTSAREAFEGILAQKNSSPDIAVRALYGLARTLETTSNGDLKPALDRYGQIVADHEDTVYAKLARNRIEALKSADAKAFYAWFSKQDPAPKDPLQRPADLGAQPGGAATGATGALDASPSSAETTSPDREDAAPPAAAGDGPAEGGSQPSADAEAAGQSTPAQEGNASSPAGAVPSGE